MTPALRCTVALHVVGVALLAFEHTLWPWIAAALIAITAGLAVHRTAGGLEAFGGVAAAVGCPAPGTAVFR